MLTMAPGPAEVDLLVRGMEKALEGRTLTTIPPQLAQLRERLLVGDGVRPALVRFALRTGDRTRLAQAEAHMRDERISDVERIATIGLLGQIAAPQSKAALVQVLRSTASKEIQSAVLAALANYSDPAIAREILALYPKMSANEQKGTRVLLAGREAWALALLEAVDQGEIEAKQISRPEAQKLSAYRDSRIVALLQKHVGKMKSGTTDEQYAFVDSYRGVLREGKGDPAQGRRAFQATCGSCHSLFGEGGNIGPDLTGADRKNSGFLLDIIAPSLYIRPEYVAHTMELNDGRTLAGFIVESAEQAVTLLDLAGQRTVAAQEQIKKLEPSPVSLMPEGLLQSLSLQEVRDLFAYMTSQ